MAREFLFTALENRKLTSVLWSRETEEWSTLSRSVPFKSLFPRKSGCTVMLCMLSAFLCQLKILALFKALTKFDKQAEAWKILWPIKDKIHIKILVGNDLQCLCDENGGVCSLFHFRYSPVKRHGQYLGTLFVSLIPLSKVLSNPMTSTVPKAKKWAFIFCWSFSAHNGKMLQTV